MKWLLCALLLLAGCGPMAVNPVLIREPRPEPVGLTVGVHYPEQIRSFTKVRRTIMLYRFTQDFPMAVGEASIKLFDEALALLFDRSVSLPTLVDVAHVDAAVAGVLETKIEAATLEMSPSLEAYATITYAFALRSRRGELVASWAIAGTGFATKWTLGDPASWPVEQRSVELAIRDAAWKFMSSFRDVPGVRRWLDEHGVR